jgi:hypothetical protein
MGESPPSHFKIMKKTNLAAIALATFLLASCGTECETKECWDSKASYESAKASNDDAAKEAAHRRNIEALNARAAAEASKPESVRIQEAKNEEPDF